MNGPQTITDTKSTFDQISNDKTVTQSNTSPINNYNNKSQKSYETSLDDHTIQTISAPTKKLRKRDIVLI